MEKNDVLKTLSSELRRGTLVLSVLSMLGEPQYGYSLLQNLAAVDVDIDQNTLYPLLRRLEQQGLLDSDWSLEQARPRRYYVLSVQGKGILQELSAQWFDLVKVMGNLLKPTGGTEE